MVVFIDESGIHQQTGHSTTAVVYVQINNLELVEKQISKFLEKINISSFHWTEHGWKVRQKFLGYIIGLNFTFKIAIFKNPVHLENMLEIVFQHLVTEKDIKRIFIDGKKPRWYERKLKKVLRDKGLSIKKLKTVRSQSYPAIQLADVLAGLARYCADNPNDRQANLWLNRFKRTHKLFAQIIFESNKKPS